VVEEVEGWRFEWSTYSFLEVKGGGRGWGWSGWRFESEWWKGWGCFEV